ncbi:MULTISPECIES: LysR family transcriptional regulator [unclassified Pseudomonas]|uniref:LysR family transcriptional regulator n=1 Tax=unclassified Pseudomonas TaxID=196821 RepID=UPI00244A0E97|nr:MULTISPECIES: LysR family transcriptional regulator [unclassified Pseudomonas]MDH0896602.1 LysR family transcriptional regulator [Pseudomonas sp. GD03875]MDH1066457.1 LysR family transcriptional regulator [Pseudomonas sp. GD03985]
MNQPHEWPELSRLDLNLLRVFEVIYRERNLTRAAARLHLSQSAVSHALARLREQIGDPLFVRDGRGVVPSALAERLAPGIQDALDGLRRSLGAGRAFDPGRDRRSFCLNMPEQMEPLLLPRVLAHLASVAPGVEVRSSGLHWAELQRDMAVGRVDLAIEITRSTDAELRQSPLFSDAFCVLAGPRFEGELSAERYLAAGHVAVSSLRRGLCAEDLALGQLGLSREVRQHCRNYLTAALLVAQGDWLLTLPRGYAELLDLGLGIRRLAMPLALPPVSLSLYWSRQAENDAAHRWLRDELLTLARTFLPGAV